MAEYRDKLIKEYNESEFKVGEIVRVRANVFKKYDDKPDSKIVNAEITSLSPNNLYNVRLCADDRYGYNPNSIEVNTILHKEQMTKDIRNIGGNPFKNINFWRKLERRSSTIEGILGELNIFPKGETYKKAKYTMNGHVIPEYTDNPYIIDKEGNKVFYQRDYVWSLKDEQLFIESIYNGLDCGKIVVRRRSWKYLEDKAKKNDIESLAFNEAVDGKQRINTLKRFINDEFKDLHGYYYSDLSDRAKAMFENSQAITYLRLGEDSTDEDVIQTFLMVNFAGKPMSQEHLDYVKEISKKM